MSVTVNNFAVCEGFTETFDRLETIKYNNKIHKIHKFPAN